MTNSRRAISSFQQSTELAEASKKVVEQAEEAVRLANARYSAGTATQLDVLTSQVDLTTARLNQLQAYYSYNVSVASVRNAMGLADEASPKGEILSEADWSKQRDSFLPSASDGDFINSLMQPQSEPGKYAGWIAPPRVGIDNKPGDFEYVKIENA